MSVEIASADTTHVPGIMRLQQVCFTSDYASNRMLRYYLEKPGGINLVCRVGGSVVGCAVSSFRPRYNNVRLYVFAIDPDYQRKSLGRRMLSAFLESAQRKNVRAVTLEVRTDNVPARHLYRDNGFAASCCLPCYYADGRDGLRLKLDLPLEPRLSQK